MRKRSIFTWNLLLFCLLSSWSARSLPGEALPEAIATHALVIGVSHYPNLSSVKSVAFADRDAIAFADYLVQSGQVRESDDLVTLINDQATADEVMTQLLLLKSRVAERAAAKQRVVLFFAGHSLIEGDNPDGGNVTLLLSDTPEHWYWNHGLRLQDLQGVVAALSVEFGAEVCLYLDVAHAPDEAVRERIGRQLHTQFTREVKFISAFPGQASLASTVLGGGRGLFSYFLVRGLSGAADQYQGDADGVVSAGELEDYLVENIVSYSLERQQPSMIGDRLSVIATYDVDPFSEAAAMVDPPLSAEPGERVGASRGLPPAATVASTREDACQASDPAQRKEAFYQAMFSGQWFSGACDALALYQGCPAGMHKEEMRFRMVNAVNWQAGRLLLEYRHDELHSRPAVVLDTLVGRLSLAMEMMPPEEVLHNTLRSRRAFFQAIAEIKRKEGPDEHSLALLQEAIQLDPYAPQAYYALGMAHYRLQAFQPALKRVRQASLLSPAWTKPAEWLPQLDSLAAAPAIAAEPAPEPSLEVPPVHTVFAPPAADSSNTAFTPPSSVMSPTALPERTRRNEDARTYGFTWVERPRTGFAVQAGAFSTYDNALLALQRLKEISHLPLFMHALESGTAAPSYRLLLGNFEEALQAEGVQKYLQEKGFEAVTVPLGSLFP